MNAQPQGLTATVAPAGPPPAQRRASGRPPVEARVFLMLQGPHGPFFDPLGRMLTLAGAQVWRDGINAG